MRPARALTVLALAWLSAAGAAPAGDTPAVIAATIANALAREGDALWGSGDFDEAGRAWALAQALDPSAPHGRLGAARYLRGRGDERGARVALEEALAASPRDPAVRRESGLSLARRDPERAASLLAGYLRESPHRSERREDVARARTALTHLQELGGHTALEEILGGVADQDLPLVWNGNVATVEVLLHGSHRALLVLDSGSSAVSLERQAAVSLGIDAFAPGRFRGLAASGQRSARLADIKSLRVGRFTLRHVGAYVGAFATPAGTAGLLPLTLLTPFRVTIDRERSRLSLRQGPAEPSREDAVVVPLWRTGDHLVIHATLGGTPLVALLDTGASAHVIDQSWLRRHLGEDPAAGGRPRRITGVAGSVAGIEVELPGEIEIGGAAAGTRRVIVLDLASASAAAGVGIDAILGAPLFDRYRVTFDLPGGKLVLEPRSPRYAK